MRLVVRRAKRQPVANAIDFRWHDDAVRGGAYLVYSAGDDVPVIYDGQHQESIDTVDRLCKQIAVITYRRADRN